MTPTPRPYTVRLTRPARKDLEDLRPWGERVLGRLLVLETNPLTGHPLAGSLRGVRSLEFALPGGAHRAAYVALEADRSCLVFALGPHENFYQLVERRYEALRRTGEI